MCSSHPFYRALGGSAHTDATSRLLEAEGRPLFRLRTLTGTNSLTPTFRTRSWLETCPGVGSRNTHHSSWLDPGGETRCPSQMSSWTLPGRPRSCLLEDANVSWMFQNGKGLWVCYGDLDNEALEVAFRKGETTPIFINQLYTVDIAKRRQKRISSNNERPVPQAPHRAQDKLLGPRFGANHAGAARKRGPHVRVWLFWTAGLSGSVTLELTADVQRSGRTGWGPRGFSAEADAGAGCSAAGDARDLVLPEDRRELSPIRGRDMRAAAGSLHLEQVAYKQRDWGRRRARLRRRGVGACRATGAGRGDRGRIRAGLLTAPPSFLAHCSLPPAGLPPHPSPLTSHSSLRTPSLFHPPSLPPRSLPPVPGAFHWVSLGMLRAETLYPNHMHKPQAPNPKPQPPNHKPHSPNKAGRSLFFCNGN